MVNLVADRSRLGENLFDHMAVDIGQASVEVVVERQAFVIEDRQVVASCRCRKPSWCRRSCSRTSSVAPVG